MIDDTPLPPPNKRFLWVSIAILGSVLALWLAFTPGGILGKADAVGYAVCHRIPERSFMLPSGRQFPMCARDTGTFLGVLIAILMPGLVFRRKKVAMFPRLPVMLVMVLCSAIWAFDGANSFSYLLPYENIPRLYAPNNFLRVTTGMFHGITMGGVLLPVFNATVWLTPVHEPSIKGFGELLAQYALGVVVISLALSDWGIFLYPLAFLSAAGTVGILAMVHTVLIATILRLDNKAANWRYLLPLFLLGLAGAIAMLGTIDAMRYMAFGNWGGFVVPGR